MLRVVWLQREAAHALLEVGNVRGWRWGLRHEDDEVAFLLGDATYVHKGARDEAFAFDRTASRLIEMGSLAYLTKQPTRAPEPLVVAKD